MKKLFILLVALGMSVTSVGQNYRTDIKITPQLEARIKSDFKRMIVPLLPDPYSYQFKMIQAVETRAPENPIKIRIDEINEEIYAIERSVNYSSEDVVITPNISRMTPAQLRAYELNNEKIQARKDSINEANAEHTNELLSELGKLQRKLKASPPMKPSEYVILIGFYARNKYGRREFARAIFVYVVNQGISLDRFKMI